MTICDSNYGVAHGAFARNNSTSAHAAFRAERVPCSVPPNFIEKKRRPTRIGASPKPISTWEASGKRRCRAMPPALCILATIASAILLEGQMRSSSDDTRSTGQLICSTLISVPAPSPAYAEAAGKAGCHRPGKYLKRRNGRSSPASVHAGALMRSKVDACQSPSLGENATTPAKALQRLAARSANSAPRDCPIRTI